MDCFLFWVPFASGDGRHIRPVSWTDPDALITPMWVKHTPDAMGWLTTYGDPNWNSFYDRKRNAQHLHTVLGYWPPPIDVPVELVPKEFKDELPF